MLKFHLHGCILSFVGFACIILFLFLSGSNGQQDASVTSAPTATSPAGSNEPCIELAANEDACYPTRCIHLYTEPHQYHCEVTTYPKYHFDVFGKQCVRPWCVCNRGYHGGSCLPHVDAGCFGHKCIRNHADVVMASRALAGVKTDLQILGIGLNTQPGGDSLRVYSLPVPGALNETSYSILCDQLALTQTPILQYSDLGPGNGTDESTATFSLLLPTAGYYVLCYKEFDWDSYHVVNTSLLYYLSPASLEIPLSLYTHFQANLRDYGKCDYGPTARTLVVAGANSSYFHSALLPSTSTGSSSSSQSNSIIKNIDLVVLNDLVSVYFEGFGFTSHDQVLFIAFPDSSPSSSSSSNNWLSLPEFMTNPTWYCSSFWVIANKDYFLTYYSNPNVTTTIPNWSNPFVSLLPVAVNHTFSFVEYAFPVLGSYVSCYSTPADTILQTNAFQTTTPSSSSVKPDFLWKWQHVTTFNVVDLPRWYSMYPIQPSVSSTNFLLNPTESFLSTIDYTPLLDTWLRVFIMGPSTSNGTFSKEDIVEIRSRIRVYDDTSQRFSWYFPGCGVTTIPPTILSSSLSYVRNISTTTTTNNNSTSSYINELFGLSEAMLTASTYFDTYVSKDTPLDIPYVCYYSAVYQRWLHLPLKTTAYQQVPVTTTSSSSSSSSSSYNVLVESVWNEDFDKIYVVNATLVNFTSSIDWGNLTILSQYVQTCWNHKVVKYNRSSIESSLTSSSYSLSRPDKIVLWLKVICPYSSSLPPSTPVVTTTTTTSSNISASTSCSNNSNSSSNSNSNSSSCFNSSSSATSNLSSPPLPRYGCQPFYSGSTVEGVVGDRFGNQLVNFTLGCPFLSINSIQTNFVWNQPVGVGVNNFINCSNISSSISGACWGEWHKVVIKIHWGGNATTTSSNSSGTLNPTFDFYFDNRRVTVVVAVNLSSTTSSTALGSFASANPVFQSFDLLQFANKNHHCGVAVDNVRASQCYPEFTQRVVETQLEKAPAFAKSSTRAAAEVSSYQLTMASGTAAAAIVLPTAESKLYSLAFIRRSSTPPTLSTLPVSPPSLVSSQASTGTSTGTSCENDNNE